MKWVTRQRIQVNRTATCWLIQRFLDPKAKFLFVPAENVASVQAGSGATGFDAPGATYPHQDEQGLCSFAALVRERLTHDAALLEMARIVQAADIKGQSPRSFMTRFTRALRKTKPLSNAKERTSEQKER